MNKYKLLALDLDGTLLNCRDIAGRNQDHHNDRPKLFIGI
jgi:hydroxymethylpyrimidine pyrophosphatase-like HAD family hydrolase